VAAGTIAVAAGTAPHTLMAGGVTAAATWIIWSGPVMGTHSFIHYFVTVTVTSLLTAVTNEFLFSSACNEVTEAIGDLKND
jgi:hypothetical protein